MDPALPTFDRLMNPLFRALEALGGSGSVEEIYDKVVELEALAVREALCAGDITRGASSQPAHAGRSVSAPDRLGRLVRATPARHRISTRDTTHAGARRTAPAPVCRKRPFAIHADRLRPRLKGGLPAVRRERRETRERVVPGTPGRAGRRDGAPRGRTRDERPRGHSNNPVPAAGARLAGVGAR